MARESLPVRSFPEAIVCAVRGLRYAARTLCLAPGYTLAAVLTLAIGVGANSAIFSAVDGQLGVAAAQDGIPDLILMDMSLPVMDGWEAIRQLKAQAATQAIPIIALTAHAMAGDRERVLASGCDDYDSKPVELPRLRQKIEILLDSAQAARTIPRLAQ